MKKAEIHPFDEEFYIFVCRECFDLYELDFDDCSFSKIKKTCAICDTHTSTKELAVKIYKRKKYGTK
jgi:hypothetical protein